MPSPKLFRFSFVSTFAIEANGKEKEFKILPDHLPMRKTRAPLKPRSRPKRPAMLARMYPLVAPWREQFIQYRTSPRNR